MIVAVYFLAIIISNLSISYFGACISPINSFFLIGLDLSLRDYLHEKWDGKNLWFKMFGMIAGAGALSYALNPAAGIIAIASSVAFLAAGLVNTGFYHAFKKMPYLRKSNLSNIPAAAADSLLFPAIAFGVWMPLIVLAQFVAKFAGGFLWSLVINMIKNETYTKLNLNKQVKK